MLIVPSVAALGPAAAPPESGGVAEPIPAFARMYRTGCSTCHTAAPKLNVLGEAFRLNGYRMPDNELLIRSDDPVPLGDEAWKDEWPRGIWPGEIPGQVPLALRLQLDAGLTRSEAEETHFDYQFPHEVYLLAGAPLGGTISTYLETVWSEEAGVEVNQAKVLFQNLIPGLPKRMLNLWLGLQNSYLFTFTDEEIDRAARLGFRWQEARPSDFTVLDPGTGLEVVSTNDFALGMTQPSVELNGLVTGRLSYGVGVGQGAGGLTSDNNRRKDVFYRLRYKFGGLDLAGSYGPEGEPVLGSGGQLLDRSVIVEHFGYFGSEPTADGGQGSHRSFGVDVRALYGRWDVGVGWTHSEYDAPWGAQVPGPLSLSSVFGKIEWLAFPWFIGSLKIDSFWSQAPDAALDEQEVRFMPGLVMLIRQNVRGVIEAELFAKQTGARELPNGLWFRLDFAF
jgi:hypothetical protein